MVANILWWMRSSLTSLRLWMLWSWKEKEPEDGFQLQEHHTLETLCQRTGDKSSCNSQTLDPGETMRFSFWSWNAGPAHYPFKDIQGDDSLPASLHVIYGPGACCWLWISSCGVPCRKASTESKETTDDELQILILRTTLHCSNLLNAPFAIWQPC